MSQAETLLNSLSGSAYAIDSTSEEYIVIGSDRVIVVPDTLKRIAVQYDHNIETVTFAGPRYWDGHDMSEMVIYINYRLPNRYLGSYIADNIRVDSTDSTRMLFDWTISNAVTQTAGSLAILVCIKKTDSSGVEINHWNSELNTELYVSEGLEGGYDTNTIEYNDVLTQLLLKMDTATAEISAEADAQITSAKESITAHGDAVLASLPADYTTTVNMVDNTIRTKADAIICSAEGDSVVVADASDDYLRGLSIFGKTTQLTTTGKNLLSPFIKGTSISTSNGSEYTSSRTAITDYIPVDFGTNPNYYLSGLLDTLYGFVAAYNSSYEFLGRTSAGAHTERSITSDIFTGGTAVGTGDIAFLRATIYENSPTVSGVIDDIDNMYAQLEIGSESTDYEPYSGGYASPSPEWSQDLVSIENPTVSIYGRNLIPSLAQDITNQGITYALNDDGSITINGTATSYSCCTGIDVDAKSFRGKTLIIRGSGTDENLVVTQIKFIWDGGYLFRSVNGKAYGIMEVPSEAETMHFEAYVPANKTISDVTVYPQLVLGTELPDYEPYIDRQSIFSTCTLPGIPVTSGGNYTDSDGQQWVCDEVDLERGVYIQRCVYGSVPTSGWQDEKTTDTYYECKTYTSENLFVNGKVLSTHFKGVDDNRLVVGSNRNFYARFPIGCGIDNLDDATTLFATGEVLFIGQLLTPIETALTDAEITTFKALHSNYPNTTVLNDAGAWMNVAYNADTKTYIDRLPKATDEQVWAAVDAWLTAKYGSIDEEASS